MTIEKLEQKVEMLRILYSVTKDPKYRAEACYALLKLQLAVESAEMASK